MKKITLLITLVFCILCFNNLVLSYSFQPPSGYNGEFGFYCNACHGSYALNSGGGQVIATGLPAGGYVPGQTYNFSITISHGSADRTRWGFEIAARNQSGNPVGDFTASPATAVISPAELSHNSATFTAPASEYTYSGLSWTAPSAPTRDDVMVNFYMAGNAANGNGSNDLDYIYSNILAITLPVRFGYFRAQVREGYKTLLEWQTQQESNTAFFVVERSVDGLSFIAIDSVPAAGNSSVARNYQFTDAWPRVFDRPVFYRLKQTDRNGHFMYSAVERVLIKNQGTFIRNIVPNPVHWGQTFYAEVMSTSTQKVTLTMVNMQGRMMYNQQVQLSEGLNALPMNPSGMMPAGHYFISIQNEHIKQRISLMVR